MAKTFQVDTGGTLTTGLLGYWKMEDATEFYNGYSVTNNGSVTFVSGKVNNASSHTAASQQYLSTTNTGIDTYTNFSVAFWLKKPSYAANMVLLGKAATNKDSFFIQWLSSANMRIQISANGTSFPTPVDVSDSLSVDTWYHIVITYQGSNGATNYYRNNTSIGGGTAPTGVHNDTSPLEFGALTEFAEYFTGNLDEIGFWNKILSATEIADLYNGGSGQTMVESATVNAGALLMASLAL